MSGSANAVKKPTRPQTAKATPNALTPKVDAQTK